MSFETQIDALLSQMTLPEKVGQMNQLPILLPDLEERIRQGEVGSVICSSTPIPGKSPQEAGLSLQVNALQKIAVEEARLGIPLLFGRDVIHGHKTVAPIPLAQAATWSPDTVRAATRVAAREASADGINWTFSPMIDITHDPRWGRIAEGFGEDPYLGSMLAQAAVEGFQGSTPGNPESVLACAKHYIGYGGAEGGRDYNTVEITETTLRNTYLPPFRAAVQAGVGSIMSAFHDLNGIPLSGHRQLINDLLKAELGFEGFVISDWAAIDEMRAHGFAADRAACATKAALAGLDMDMASQVYADELIALVENGIVPESAIDEAVRRILRVKLQRGLFTQPYTDVTRAAVHLHPDHLQVVREAAAKSLVLLENDGTLPLNRAGLAIGLFGPLVKERGTLLGAWALNGHEEGMLSVFDAVKAKVGADNRLIEATLTDDALRLAPECDVIIVVVGESLYRTGENSCLTNLDLPPGQRELIEALHARQVPLVVVVLAGRPLALDWLPRCAASVLYAWHPGTEGARAVADALFGDVNPGGKLPVTFPRRVGQIPIYYNHKSTGRPLPPNDPRQSRYQDQPDSPLYPFGYGLSYTSFDYRNLQINQDTPGIVSVSAEISNTGTRAGDEIVQLYIRDLAASICRPVRELKGFKRLSLAPGETQTVRFELSRDDLAFYDAAGAWLFEPGEFEVWIAPHSQGGLAGRFSAE